MNNLIHKICDSFPETYIHQIFNRQPIVMFLLTLNQHERKHFQDQIK